MTSITKTNTNLSLFPFLPRLLPTTPAHSLLTINCTVTFPPPPPEPSLLAALSLDMMGTGNRRMSERDLSRMGGAESSKSLIANSHTSHSLNQHLNLSNSNINSSHTLSHSHTNNSNSNNNSSIIMNPLAAHLPNSKSVPALHHHTGSGNICK